MISKAEFLRRFGHSLLVVAILVGVSLVAGMVGYRVFEGYSWTDAFMNASMILGGMGPVNPVVTQAGKIFAGAYALYSGLAFLVLAGFLFAPDRPPGASQFSLRRGSGGSKAVSLRLTAVVAMTPDRVIGRDGGLPWALPEDLAFFKRTTSGHPIVMGRKTFESIGRPLPKRRNIVLTRDAELVGGRGGGDPPARPSSARLPGIDGRVFIIGGSEIYAAFLPELEDLLVSHVFENHPGDTWFPEFESSISGHRKSSKPIRSSRCGGISGKPDPHLSGPFACRVSACK